MAGPDDRSPGPPRESPDVFAATLPVLLAVVLALTSPLNSDLWLRLASGREILAGGLFPATDPFAYPASAGGESYPEWLADVAAFLIYRNLGGPTLVVLEAVLCAAVAACLLRLARVGTRPLLASVAVSLALAAVALRLPLHPVCFSYLFLALTLVGLDRVARKPAPGNAFAELWPLLPLFALWSNLDSWFLLGPLAVGLYALGGRLRPGEGGSLPPKGIAPFALAGLAACSLNPAPWRPFHLPTELAPGEAGRVLRDDPFVRAGLFSPLQADFYRPGVGAGVVAFLILAVLGLAAGVANRRALRGSWAAVWAGLLALALYRARAVPFFALLGGPFLVWNLAPLLPAVAGATRRILRLGVLVFGFAALAAAWPGWLQPPPFEARGWRVEPDPSCVRLAGRLARWREAGDLPPGEAGFNFSPHTADQLAWLLPGERWFLDSRLRRFGPAVDEFEAVRRAVVGGEGGELRRVFRERRIGYLLLADEDRIRMASAFQRLLDRPDEWPLLGLEGNVAVFGWRDPKASPAAFEPFDPVRALSRPDGPPAPPRGAGRFAWNRPLRSADRAGAALDLMFFEASRRRGLRQGRLVWDLGSLAGLLGSADRPGLALLPANSLGAWAAGPTDAGTPAGTRLATALWADHQARRDDGPPAALYLAIRSARRAVRADPEDAVAQTLLGEAYTRLSRQTAERLLGRPADRDLSLGFLRQVQAVAALRQAVASRPDLVQAHAALVGHYQDLGMTDLALDHARAWLRLARRAGPAKGEDAEAFAGRVAALDARAGRLEAAVAQAEQRFATTPASLSLAARAEAARRLGLAKAALAMLEGSNVAAFGARGAVLELHLLLLTGRVREADEWLDPELVTLIGPRDYHALRYLVAAALGDEDAAAAHLEELARPLGTLGRTASGPGTPVREVVALAATQMLLEQPIAGRTAVGVAWCEVDRLRTAERVRGWASGLAREADLTTLRALLALEDGAVDRATLLLGRALSVWGGGRPGAGVDFPTRPLASRYLDMLRRGADRR